MFRHFRFIFLRVYPSVYGYFSVFRLPNVYPLSGFWVNMGKHLVKHFAEFASICEDLRLPINYLAHSKHPCLSAFPPFYGGSRFLQLWSWRESNAKRGIPLFIEVLQLFVDIF
jgi:hypothetical protein